MSASVLTVPMIGSALTSGVVQQCVLQAFSAFDNEPLNLEVITSEISEFTPEEVAHEMAAMLRSGDIGCLEMTFSNVFGMTVQPQVVTVYILKGHKRDEERAA